MNLRRGLFRLWLVVGGLLAAWRMWGDYQYWGAHPAESDWINVGLEGVLTYVFCGAVAVGIYVLIRGGRWVLAGFR